jgi:TonB family protein
VTQAFFVVLAPVARAQSEPSIVAPRLTETPEVPYPADARGDAVVELELTVARDGSVAEARVATGLEPFSAAALEAARRFHFVPATRDGKAVVAKIRFEVKFTEPKREESVSGGAENEPAKEAPPAMKTTAPGSSRKEPTEAPRPPRATPAEVTVYGTRVRPGGVSMGRSEVRQLPGAFGDPFRAIESLPGLTPIVSGVPFFYVRGAPPGNVGYFLDGVRVPYLFHAALGPSVVHPAMIDHVDLYPGGYPAEFGRFAGGIVTAETTTPSPTLHGEGNIRLLDAGALVEGGFADGRGTALVGGRYSYTAAIVSLFAQGVTLDYRDYQARFTYDLTRDDRVSVFTFGAYDLFGQTENGIFNVGFGAEFHRADLRWEHDLGDDGVLRADMVLGFDQTRIPNQPRNSRDDSANAKLSYARPISKHAVLRAGLDGALDTYNVDARPYSDPDDPTTQRFNALFPERTDVAFGVYSEISFKWGIAELSPGVRGDVYTSAGASAPAVDPRISSRLAVARHVHVIHTLGLVHQPPSFLIPLPGLAIGSLNGGLQTSLQSSAGVEVELPAETTATVTVFDNAFFNMTDTLGAARSLQNSLFREPRSQGSAIGAEVFIRRKLTQKLGGFISYTLSRSTRSIGSEHFVSSFDRTHVVNAAVAYDLGRRWRAGTRVTAYSGMPAIPPSNGLIPPPRSSNPERDPAFYRIDLRLEKRWILTKSAWLALVAEMMNVTLNKEVVFSREIGPVSPPSIGLEGGF